MANNQAHMMTAAEIRKLETSAASLIASLKGIQDARVEIDAHGHIVRIEVVPQGIDDRAATRNAQSAVAAALGQNVDVNRIVVVSDVRASVDARAGAGASDGSGARDGAGAGAGAGVPDGVIELKIPPLKNGELNVAARVAFETLRAAQSSFHGFQFDGAELVRINGFQYVVVALRSVASETKYCGASPVLESVSTASARALMNAVGTAAMGGSAMDIGFGPPEYGVLEA